jgi:hypothetical protein
LVLGGGAGAAPATTTTGTGVVTALGITPGTAGAFVVNGGALGTPSSGTVTNLTGTASININGTVGATTKNTGAFTTLSATRPTAGDAITVTSGSAIGYIYVDGSSIVLSTTANAGAGSGRLLLGSTSVQLYSPDQTRTIEINNSGVELQGPFETDGVVQFKNYGAGTATFSSIGVISSVSDETWKIKDGAPVDPDSMLNKLEPGYWYYNDEQKETFGADRQLGFYAQNVNAAIGPEAAPEPEEGKPWGYYDRSVLAVTVMSLQKALATIESLTARITALEAK